MEINRSMAAWQNFGLAKPYKKSLQAIVGKAVPISSLWNPDAVLNVDDIKHSRATQERCDKAAACQMLFEDCVFHIVRFLASDVCEGRCDKLVWTGGCALNCAASMRLGERFGPMFFERRRRGHNADAKRGNTRLVKVATSIFLSNIEKKSSNSAQLGMIYLDDVFIACSCFAPGLCETFDDFN